MNHFVLSSSLLLAIPALLPAQRLTPYTWLRPGRAQTPQVRSQPSYWLEGATIGAAVVGTTGAWAAYELGCHFSDVSSDCKATKILAGGLVGGLAGGIVGGLVGGAFSAPRPRPLRSHPVRTTLIGAGAGALWGFGLFSQFCTNGCRSEEVALGFSTTGAGALAGLLIGHR
jgi:hypothetical protein